MQIYISGICRYCINTVNMIFERKLQLDLQNHSISNELHSLDLNCVVAQYRVHFF